MDLIKLMSIQNFAILDVEYIATSRYHNCIRKVHILSKDGLTKSTKEFYPCKKYNEIEEHGDRKGFYLIGAVLVFVVGATLVSMLN